MHTIQRILITSSATGALIVLLLSSSVAPATAGSSTIDADADSYPDCYEQDMYKNDHDNDGTKDSDDTDDDNDGIADTEDSKPKDADNDGKSDQTENRNTLNSETDSDGDGYLDMVEKSEYQKNHDQDGKKDSDDSDDDNDGLADSDEASKMKRNHDNDKKDGQGYQDGKDPDNDNDGINDWDETKCSYIYDHDNDGSKDAKDTDDDNDDIEDTEDEYLNDSDNDGVKDDKDDDNNTDDDSDDTDEEFSLSSKRIFYGYIVSDYDNNGDGIHETEHLVSEGAFLYMGEDDGRLLEVEVSQSGSAERTDDEGDFEYNISDSSEVEVDESEAAYAGRIDAATGEYQFAFGLDDDQPHATYTNAAGETSTFTWPKLTNIGAGGGNEEDCNEVDLADNALDGPSECAYTINSEGIMKGEFIDQTFNYDERGSQRTANWKLVPTSCTSIEGCVRPKSSYPSEDDYKDNDDVNS